MDAMPSPRLPDLGMFDKSAHLYDLAYSFKDYAAESAWVRNDFTLGSLWPEASSMLRAERASTWNTSGETSTARDSISTLSSWKSHSNEPE